MLMKTGKLLVAVVLCSFAFGCSNVMPIVDVEKTKQETVDSSFVLVRNNMGWSIVTFLSAAVGGSFVALLRWYILKNKTNSVQSGDSVLLDLKARMQAIDDKVSDVYDAIGIGKGAQKNDNVRDGEDIGQLKNVLEKGFQDVGKKREELDKQFGEHVLKTVEKKLGDMRTCDPQELLGTVQELLDDNYKELKEENKRLKLLLHKK